MNRQQFRNHYASTRKFNGPNEGTFIGNVLFYKADTGRVLISWKGVYACATPAWRADGIVGNRYFSKEYRRWAIAECREYGPVPLPH